MSTTTAPAPFIFDRKYANHEQVRYLMPEFLEVRARLIATGRGTERMTYDADYKGQMPSLATTDDSNEDTAIYLLKTLAMIDAESAREAEYLANGYRRITVDDIPEGGALRGDVVRRGWYAGGTGWWEKAGVRVVKTPGRFGHLAALPPRNRTNGYDLSGGWVLFREVGA